MILTAFIAQLSNYGADQVSIQRYLSARSLEDCRKGFVMNAVAYVFYSILFVALSMSLLVYFRHNPLPQDTPYEYFFPYFIAWNLPVFVKGLIIAAIYAAAQSSVSAGISSSTSVIYSNLYVRLKYGQISVDESFSQDIKKQHLFFARLCSLFLGIAVTTLACFVQQLGTLFALFNKIVGNFAGIMIPVFLLGMFSRRARSLGVSIGAVCGLIAMLLWGFGHKLGLFEKELGYGWTTVVGFVVTIVLGYAISLFETAPRPEKMNWLWRNVMAPSFQEQGRPGYGTVPKGFGSAQEITKV